MVKYLVGENVRLRNIETVDIDFLCEIENNSQNWSVSDTLAPYFRTTMEEYIQSESLGIWANGQQRFIIDNQEKGTVGAIDIYDVDIFSHLDFQMLYAYVETGNKPSISVMDSVRG